MPVWRSSARLRPLDPLALEEALLEVARRAGVQIRKERFDPGIFGQAGRRGGLCLVGGARVILLDTQLTTIERVGVLCEALSGLDLEPISMLPIVRERIDLCARRRAHAARARRGHLRRVV
jgi:hypothetical protein